MSGHKKRILFLSYWSLREPLNASAVFPYLRILSERDDVEQVDLVTLETAAGDLPEVVLDLPKVRHIALDPWFARPHLLAKALLFARAIPFLVRHIRRERIGLIIAKASLAGALADIIHSLIGVPYNVESFEPHAVYMLECGVWSRSSLRFRFLDHMEQRQLRRAQYVITVTNNHANDLVAAGISSQRVRVIPSITDLIMFRLDPDARSQARSELGIAPASTVGIYVGKFGGLYFDEEAFFIFRRAFDHFPDLHLVVLSPMDHDALREKAAAVGIPLNKLHFRVVPHTQVPTYLSAADWAFSTIKPSPIKRYQCPIKNGEYWACGLPILMTDGVSDDYLMMREGVGGHVFRPDLSDLDDALNGMVALVGRSGVRNEMRALAERYRSIELARRVYTEVI